MRSRPGGRALRVGFALAQDPAAGGLYQYSATALSALDELADRGTISDIVVFATNPQRVRSRWPVVTLDPDTQSRGARRGAAEVVRRSPRIEEALQDLRRRARARRVQPLLERGPLARDDLTAWYQRHGVDVMFYPTPDARSFEAATPSIIAVHDLQHRIQPEFPEVSACGEWAVREYVYRFGVLRAAAVLVDSEQGKQDLLEHYGPFGLDESAIVVVPFIPSVRHDPAIDPPCPSGLPEQYLYYPAQFWPHKNHERLVAALGAVVDRGFDLHLVLSGSNTGRLRRKTYRRAVRLAEKLGLTDRVHYLGYVPDDALPGLYANATALVMPTFFGPTNIPVLEAWEFGCPVVTSDLSGIREQVGDAGVLVDPRSAPSIADGIIRVVADEEARRRVVAAGTVRLAAYTPADFTNQVAGAIETARQRIAGG